MKHLIKINLTEAFNFFFTPSLGVWGLLLLFLLSPVISVQAQDTILNRSVSVEREYRPVIQDAGKINSVPQVLEPTVDKTPAKYSDFNLPLDAGFNIHTLPAAGLTTEKASNKEGYARIGIGNYLNTLLDFAYPVINEPDMKLDFSLNHLGTFDAKRIHTTTKTALSFDKIFKTLDLYAGIGGGHEAFNYYGNNYTGAGIVDLKSMASTYPSYIYTEVNRAGISAAPRSYTLDSLSKFPTGDTFWRFNVQAGVRSLPMSTDLRYLAEVNYNTFSAVNGLSEKLVRTIVNFSSPSDDNRLGLDFDLSNMMYSSAKIPNFNFWKNYSVMTINPYYSVERPNWNVRIGIKSSFAFVHGKMVNPSADMRAEWKAIPKNLSFYGGITGDYQVNTLDKIFSENPYLYSDIRVNDTYTPYDLFAGIKLKPLYNLLIDAYVDMRQIDNQYFFVNKGYLLNNYSVLVDQNPYLSTNRFNVVYSGASLVKTGIRANYNLQNFLNVELKYVINNWTVDTQQYAWNKPNYEAEMNTNLRISPDLSVSANVFYQGGRYAKLGTTAIPMHDKVDINLGITYSYLNWFTAFAKINNLINNQYQDYYGYDVQGTNMMVGAAFSF